jgi:hypothetical protein
MQMLLNFLLNFTTGGKPIMNSEELNKLLDRTRKVPKTGKQRCFRLALELDTRLQEIADAATAITGYNVSLAHVARMIIENYHMEILDSMTGRVQELKESAMQDIDYDEDLDLDLEDTEDDEEETDPETDPEEEYIKNLLSGAQPVTSVKWGE